MASNKRSSSSQRYYPHHQHYLLQACSLLVFVLVVLVLGNMMLARNPANSLVGNVVTAIEDLKETRQEQSFGVLAFTIGLTAVLVLVYLYLRKYDVPTYG